MSNLDDDLDYRPRGDKPCPSCPDGSVWDSNGSTAKTCPVCNGYATVNLDGSPIAPKRKPRRLVGAPMDDLCVKEDWFENEADFHDFLGLD